MLIISRKLEEKFVIGGNIEITIIEVSGNKVRFGITAPREIEIQKRYIPEATAANPPDLPHPQAQKLEISATATVSKTA